jgi:hypothetical protein
VGAGGCIGWQQAGWDAMQDAVQPKPPPVLQLTAAAGPACCAAPGSTALLRHQPGNNRWLRAARTRQPRALHAALHERVCDATLWERTGCEGLRPAASAAWPNHANLVATSLQPK